MSGLLFFLMTALLLLGAIFLFYRGFESQTTDDEQTSRNRLNQALYYARKTELHAEAEQGLVPDESALQTELQHQLLVDVPEVQPKAESVVSITTWRLLPALLVLIVLSYGLYWQLGSYAQVQQWQQTASRLPELMQRQQESAWAPLTDDEQQRLILALRSALDKNPNDVDGWLTLGDIALNGRDLATAIGATRRAYGLSPNDNTAQLAYAQSLLLSNDDASHQQARQLLRTVLQRDHQNLQALSLLAFDAFQRQAFAEAVGAWQVMKQLIPADDSRQVMLDRSIAKAQSELGIVPEVLQQVTVNVDATVDLKRYPHLIVAIYSPDMPVPVAVKQLRVDQMPQIVVLNDSDSMMPDRLLSSLASMRIKVRLDDDQDIMTKAGNWFAQSELLPLGEPVTLTINQQYEP